ncbi:MAG TPA: cohesin domain-containing protein [Terriglobales bacterium]
MLKAARVLALVMLCSVGLVAADSAKDLYKKGMRAEARRDYEAAYTYYREAYQLKPEELRYRVPYERLRFLAAADLVHRAQKLRDEGKLQEALALFEKAATIDPSNDLAAQEIRHTQEMIQKQSGQSETPPLKKEEDALHRILEQAQPPVMLAPISQTPITALEFASEDVKVIYETLGKLAGINVLFDPDFQSRRIPLKLKNVTLQEALDILALESRTFWRTVTPNTIFVAADTQAKRRELEQNVIKTFYLGNVSSPTDLQDIVNAIRTVLEVQRIQQIPSQNAIVIKGTPDQLALAEKMVDDIDKAKPEVVVDVIVAQVRRDKTRNIGIIPPQTATINLQPPSSVLNTTTTTTPGTTTTTPTTTGLNFNNLQHLNSTSYALTIAPIQLQALLNDIDTKIMQNPRLRATNGEKAKLTIADKIPIATGSFGTPLGVGTAVGAVGVNTQFTYTDVGVVMEITPTIHPDGQVTLKTSLQVSNLNGSSTIGGITQPIISQRSEELFARLRDGEISMVGGIMEQDYTRTIAGTPFLGEIPILKYFFSQEQKEVVSNEIVFLMIPHIVRKQELDAMNQKAFDVGTGTAIDLRIAGRPTHNDNGPAAASVIPQPGSVPVVPTPLVVAPGAPVAPAPPSPQTGATPGALPQETTSRSPQSVVTPSSSPASPVNGLLSVRLDPGTVTQAQGSTFSLNVVLTHGQDITAVPVQIAYDPNVMQFMNVSGGDFLTKDGQAVSLVHRDDAAAGKLLVSAQRPPGSAGVSGDGTVFSLEFKAKTKGAGVVSISVPNARNSQNQTLTVQGSQAAVTVN